MVARLPRMPVAVWTVKPGDASAQAYQDILESTYGTHRGAVDPAEEKRYDDPEEYGPHAHGYRRRYDLGPFRHSGRRKRLVAYREVDHRSREEQHGQDDPYEPETFHQRRPLRLACSFIICCCWRCISSRRAIRPLFFFGFLAFSAMVRRTSSSFIIKRKA